ncbi:MAG: S-methyl-5-thioribose-1-phosphate isomerase [Planctomycetota bacterium]|nr:S-methyl-5-thioribose-1-phosphate isomerase [Planctomycetota bacterium]
MIMTSLPTPHHQQTLRSVEWSGDWQGKLKLLDQTQLPAKIEMVDCVSVAIIRESIVQLRVRGAPAIGIAAAYGAVVAFQESISEQEVFDEAARSLLNTKIEDLRSSRPTAVNLSWALNRMSQSIADFSLPADAALVGKTLLAAAIEVHEEDKQMCHAIGRFGAERIADRSGVLTHCNTGGLATSEYGTALSAMLTAQDQGKHFHVFVDETRPLLQGARLTAWELMQREIPCTLICDSMAAQVMREGRVQAVFVGADRITACGDAANKIGTYGLAILAKYHNVPFYVAAPSSTFDLSLVSGSEIPIERRNESEITEAFGKRTAPERVAVYNPAFDVTPADLITAIITEKGIIEPVNEQNVREMLHR